MAPPTSRSGYEQQPDGMTILPGVVSYWEAKALPRSTSSHLNLQLRRTPRSRNALQWLVLLCPGARSKHRAIVRRHLVNVILNLVVMLYLYFLCNGYTLRDVIQSKPTSHTTVCTCVLSLSCLNIVLCISWIYKLIVAFWIFNFEIKKWGT